MGILASVKAKRHLARLRDDLKRNPSPTTVGELARYYIQLGQDEAAYHLVKESLEQYKDSEILKNLWKYVRKSRVDDKSRDAIRALEEDPAPESFVTVIRSFREVEDLELLVLGGYDHAVPRGGGAGCWESAHALYLDYAHPAGAEGLQLWVGAQCRYVEAGLSGRLEDSLALLELHLFAVDGYHWPPPVVL